MYMFDSLLMLAVMVLVIWDTGIWGLSEKTLKAQEHQSLMMNHYQRKPEGSSEDYT